VEIAEDRHAASHCAIVTGSTSGLVLDPIRGSALPVAARRLVG